MWLEGGSTGSVVVSRGGLLVCPAFPVCSGSAVSAGWSEGRGGWWAVADGVAPQCEPVIYPGPVAGEVQDGAALGSGQPGGDGDDFASQRGAAGYRVGTSGEDAGGAKQVVGDRCAQHPGGVGPELS